jgi:hypothetical protein
VVTETLSGGSKSGEVRQTFIFDAESNQFGKKITKVQKQMEGTGKSVKKAGEEGQKALSGWEKALNRAGSAAYDFGSTTLQSTTVMEALQEGAAGALEMALMGVFEDPGSMWGDLFAEALGGPLGLALKMGLEEGITGADWPTLGRGIGTHLGKEAGIWFSQEFSPAVSTATKKAITEEDWANTMRMAMAADDWAGVTSLIDSKFRDGDYTELAKSIKLSISSGNYEAAASYIDEALAAHDYNFLGRSLTSANLASAGAAIETWASTIGKSAGMSFAQGMQEAVQSISAAWSTFLSNPTAANWSAFQSTLATYGAGSLVTEGANNWREGG